MVTEQRTFARRAGGSFDLSAEYRRRNAAFLCLEIQPRREAMFDSKLVDLNDGHSDEPPAAGTLPWQVVALLVCLIMLSIVAAFLYPDVFGTPFEQF